MGQIDSGALALAYKARGNGLFSLAIRTGILSVITAGIYRFWAKTRVRKRIWSSISVDGDPLEYTGTGLEKFLGFLVAMVVLAVYMGIVQMALFYYGLNLFIEPTNEIEALLQMAAIYLTFLAIWPLMLFARYRARRYKLARTRWRGIRFAMDNGAWGYVLRAMGHSIITGLTLGILLPRQTFYLEKYMADRMWFGNAQFRQAGSWPDLFLAMKHLFIGIGLLVFGAALLGISGAADLSDSLGMIGLIMLGLGYLWWFVGMISYRVQSIAYLTNEKVLGRGIRFELLPRTGKVIGIFLMGAILIGVVAGLLFGGLGLLGFGGMMLVFDAPVIGFGILAIGYVLSVVVIEALSLTLITQPIMAHMVDSAEVIETKGLAEIRQREHDKGADAEGFADALDVGGAI